MGCLQAHFYIFIVLLGRRKLNPEACLLCGKEDVTKDVYGEKRSHEGITIHYFCAVSLIIFLCYLLAFLFKKFTRSLFFAVLIMNLVKGKLRMYYFITEWQIWMKFKRCWNSCEGTN